MEDTLGQWRVDFSASLRLNERGHTVYRDEAHWCWHLMWLEDSALVLRRVRLKVWVFACEGCSTELYFHQFGLIDVAALSPRGEVAHRGAACESLTVERREDGCLIVEVVYVNRHHRLFIGTRSGGGYYKGTGRDQYAFERVEISAEPAELRWAPDAERVHLIDVGGAGGVQDKWLPHLERVTPVLFEPNPVEAVKLAPWHERIPGARVIQQGLLDTVGPQELKITRGWGCTSLRQPNAAFLADYSIAPNFEVLRTVPVECTRYDLLFEQGLVPRPDVIKIDVQGCEYEVLTGFGNLLDGCLGIELEAHFYPIYQGQKLLHDLIALLREHGLTLRTTSQVGNFDGDAVEVDAFFTLSRSRVSGLERSRRRKLELIHQVWGLDPLPPALPRDVVPRLHPQIVWEEVADSIIVVDMSTAQTVYLKDGSVAMWKLLTSGCTISEMVQQHAAHRGKSLDAAGAELAAYLDELCERKILSWDA